MTVVAKDSASGPPVPAPPPPPSEAQRQAALIRIRDASKGGGLSLEEFSASVDGVLAARTAVELESIVAGLPSGDGRALAPRPVSASLPAMPAGEGWSVAVLSQVTRRGRWLVRRGRVLAFLGSIELDLRAAELDGPELVLTSFSILGEVKLIVPEGIPIHIDGITILGGRNVRLSRRPLVPDAPSIHVRAFTLLGQHTITDRGSFIQELIERARSSLG